MKSIIVKIMILGIVAAAFFSFCPLVMPVVNQAFAPPAAPAPVVPPPGVRHLQKVEDLVFELTNQARREKNLAPLRKDAELSNVARAYSDDMLVRGFFDHTTPDGISFDERISDQYSHWTYIMGENIWSAVGYDSGNSEKLARQMVNDWMSSPGHRKNLLNPNYTHLGVGVSVRRNTFRATQEFVGKPNGISVRKFLSPWLMKLNKACEISSSLKEDSFASDS